MYVKWTKIWRKLLKYSSLGVWWQEAKQYSHRFLLLYVYEMNAKILTPNYTVRHMNKLLLHAECFASYIHTKPYITYIQTFTLLQYYILIANHENAQCKLLKQLHRYECIKWSRLNSLINKQYKYIYERVLLTWAQ